MDELERQKYQAKYNSDDDNENQQTDEYSLENTSSSLSLPQVSDSKISFYQELNQSFLNNDENNSDSMPLNFDSKSTSKIQQSVSCYPMTESSSINDLDRENVHFIISEAVISVIEFRKHINLCSLSSFFSSLSNIYDTSGSEFEQRIRIQKRNSTHSLNDSTEESFSNSLSNFEDNFIDYQLEKNEEVLEDFDLHSLSMASLYSEIDLKQDDNLLAEELAINLLKKCQIKYQSLENKIFNKKNISNSISSNNSMINQSLIVLTLHKSPNLRKDIASQNYKCANCGTIVLPKYISKLRYCHYFGKYYCTLCHQNQSSLIPAKILFQLNFKKYRVSRLAFKFLTKTYTTPILNIVEINSYILNKYKNFQKYNLLRNQLFLIKDYIFNCRFAHKISAQLLEWPEYFYCDLEMYSVKDLIEIKDNKKLKKLSDLINTCDRHILSCILCSAKGYICEICKKDDILFPWHTKITTRCLICKSCYHWTCWDSKIDYCLKCFRQMKRSQFLT